jgi:hypothetical protein
MVQDDEAVGLDGLAVEFDDERAVSDAGIALVAVLAGDARGASEPRTAAATPPSGG